LLPETEEKAKGEAPARSALRPKEEQDLTTDQPIAIAIC
jgi:hypothetical protein